MKAVAALGAAALLLAGGPGLAATGQARPDPERMICKSRPVIGSRLERVRECHSALEWQEMKRSEQLGLMRKQVNGDPGCNGGNREICHPEIGGGKDTPW